MKVIYCGYIVFIVHIFLLSCLVLPTLRCQTIRDSIECLSSSQPQHCSDSKHKLDCGHDSVIEILQATYGLNAIETDSDDEDIDCCNKQSIRGYQLFNLSERLSLYRGCSGKLGSCEVHTGHKFISNSLQAITSNIQYNCLKIDSYNDLCKDTSSKFKSENTHLVFRPDFVPLKFPEGDINACRCSVYAGQTFSVDVKTTDVRLDRWTIDENPSNLCSSAVLKIKENDTEDSRVFSCSDNNRPTFEYSNVVNGTAVAIHLDNMYITGKDDVPTVIWIQISKNSNEYVTINCSMKYNNGHVTSVKTSEAIHTSHFWPTTETSLISSGNITSVVQFEKTSDYEGKIGVTEAIIICVVLVAVCIIIAALFCYRRNIKKRNSEKGQKFDTCHSADVLEHNNQTESNSPALADLGEYAAVNEVQDTDETYNTTNESSSVQKARTDSANIYDKFNKDKDAEYDGVHLQGITSTVNDNNFYSRVNKHSEKGDFYDTTFLTGNPKSIQDNGMVYSVVSSKQDLNIV